MNISHKFVRVLQHHLRSTAVGKVKSKNINNITDIILILTIINISEGKKCSVNK